MRIQRTIQQAIEAIRGTGKAIVLQGARQVGKTTLIHALFDDTGDATLWVDGDDQDDRRIWNNVSKANLPLYLGQKRYLIIDEAQRIENIGLTVKMIIDAGISVEVVLSGSSTLNLASTINEPLTGRKWSFELFPLSWAELSGFYGTVGALRQLEQRLILGGYPEVVTADTQKESRLREIANSYLYKDILDFGLVRKPEIIIQLLRALAYQVGSEVSYNEVGNALQINNETVRRYIQLLEESYVIFRLAPLSTNPRKEIFTSRKIYFFDNGIRNAVIGELGPLAGRNDIGQLWENFIVSEFYKKTAYANEGTRLYFWRDKQGAEVDLIIGRNGTYSAYEIKYNPRKTARFPKAFLDRYAPVSTETINRDNFIHYL